MTADASPAPPSARDPGRRTGPASLYGAVLVVATAVLLSYGCTQVRWSEMFESTPARVPFDAETWRQGTEAQRVAMIDDVYESKVLLGKTREELEALLGPPSRVGFGLLAWNATAAPRRSGGSDRDWPGISVWIEKGGEAYEMVGGRGR